jgi:hypothetical protein
MAMTVVLVVKLVKIGKKPINLKLMVASDGHPSSYNFSTSEKYRKEHRDLGIEK